MPTDDDTTRDASTEPPPTAGQAAAPTDIPASGTGTAQDEAPDEAEDDAGSPDTAASAGDVAAPATESQISYEATPQRGQRITRRTVRRREVHEDTEETITEDIVPPVYQAPSSRHPAPVG